MKRHFLTISLCLLSCGSPIMPQPANPTTEPAKTAEPAPPVHEGPVQVNMRVIAMTASEPDPHEIANGQSLKSGDKVALKVNVDQPAYVYIAQTSSDGSAARIYPESGDVEVFPDSPIYVPQEGQWFKLDQNAGQENFFVYAAKQVIPPDTLDARMKSDAATVIVMQAKKPVTQSKPRSKHAAGATGPGGLSPTRRGVEVVRADVPNGPTVTSSGVYIFTIQHRK